MDRVRLGRALGKGARAAARTAMEAVEAATAPDPAPKAAPSSRPATPRPVSSPTVLPPAVRASNVIPAARAATKSVSSPLRKASSALWHEVTGSFFALFALSFAGAAWHIHTGALNATPGDRYRFYAFCAFTLLFAYFSVSNFLRARKA